MGKGRLNLSRTLTAHNTRTSSWGFVWRAMVWQRQRHAVSNSKVEHCFRWCGMNLRRVETSVEPKKMVRRAMTLLSGIGTTTVEAMSMYSWCVHVTWVGSLAWRRCLCHTGKMEGAHAPRATSPMAIMNCTNPTASLMVWFRRTAKMKPPHLRRVTCPSSPRKMIIGLYINKEWCYRDKYKFWEMLYHNIFITFS